MDAFEKREKKREAQQRLRAQRRRAGQLRGRVAAISLIAFVLLWGVVFVQMATGNDPVLNASSRTTRTAPRAATEAIETSAPEEVESEVAEPEPVEAEEEPVEAEAEALEIEAIEAEAEALELEAAETEPAPVTTSQS